MDTLVTEEVAVLKQMILNWHRGYLTWVQPGEDNDYVLEEFHEDITNHLFPYVSRLLALEYLTQEEATELMDHCYSAVGRLKKDIAQMGVSNE